MSFCAVLVAMTTLWLSWIGMRLESSSDAFRRNLLAVSVKVAPMLVSGPATQGIVIRTALILRQYWPG